MSSVFGAENKCTTFAKYEVEDNSNLCISIVKKVFKNKNSSSSSEWKLL
jgi:hypothetical protein